MLFSSDLLVLFQKGWALIIKSSSNLMSGKCHQWLHYAVPWLLRAVGTVWKGAPG